MVSTTASSTSHASAPAAVHSTCAAGIMHTTRTTGATHSAPIPGTSKTGITVHTVLNGIVHPTTPSRATATVATTITKYVVLSTSLISPATEAPATILRQTPHTIIAS